MNIEKSIAAAQRMMLDKSFWEDVDKGASMMPESQGKHVTSRETRMFEHEDFNDVHLIDERAINQRQMEQNLSKPGSHLPDAIRESFQRQAPISGEEYQYMADIPTSFLDNLGGLGLNQIQQQQVSQHRQQPQQQKRNINETRQIQQPMQQQYQQSSNVGGIDYNYIKYLINESITEALKRQPLNEGNNLTNCLGMRMLPGNKFQFMDTKGNLYEGVLTLKKRAQQK